MAKVLCWRETELDVSEMHFILPVDNSLHKRKNLELPRCIIERYKYLMHKVIQFRKEKSTRRVLEHWFVLKIWSGNRVQRSPLVTSHERKTKGWIFLTITEIGDGVIKTELICSEGLAPFCVFSLFHVCQVTIK